VSAADVAELAARVGAELRREGLAATPGQCERFARSLVLAAPLARRRTYWIARVCFLTAPELLPALERALARVLDPELQAGAVSARVEVHGPLPARRAARSFEELMGVPGQPNEAQAASGSPDWSPAERLARRRFDRLTREELAQLRALMRRISLRPPLRESRRTRRAPHGSRVDLRRTLRRAARSHGEPLRIARRARRVRPRALVALCDISGSMAPFARACLQFLSCAADGLGAEIFVFATRLTRISRALRGRDADLALRRAGEAAPDWSGGTRLGDALAEFNRRYARRSARGAVVVILSDGWERGDPERVGREMARLRRLAHRIVWVNPRAGETGFAPTAAGMAAAYPWCDALLPGADLAGLSEVAREIASSR
jgi:uncharacterized protein with von Willebrand factor type A (vWA) domain